MQSTLAAISKLSIAPALALSCLCGAARADIPDAISAGDGGAPQGYYSSSSDGGANLWALTLAAPFDQDALDPIFESKDTLRSALSSQFQPKTEVEKQMLDRMVDLYYSANKSGAPLPHLLDDPVFEGLLNKYVETEDFSQWGKSSPASGSGELNIWELALKAPFDPKSLDKIYADKDALKRSLTSNFKPDTETKRQMVDRMVDIYFDAYKSGDPTPSVLDDPVFSRLFDKFVQEEDFSEYGRTPPVDSKGDVDLFALGLKAPFDPAALDKIYENKDTLKNALLNGLEPTSEVERKIVDRTVEILYDAHKSGEPAPFVLDDPQISRLLDQYVDNEDFSKWGLENPDAECRSPCALKSIAPGLDQYASNSAYHFASASPQAATIVNAFGAKSQFDFTWVNARSQGPVSQFDLSWINARSQGPVSQFDQTWINQRSFGATRPNDWSWMTDPSRGGVRQTSWSAKFPSTSGINSTNQSEMYAGLSRRVVAELEGLDARTLFDKASRDAAAERLAATLVREFDVDPAVGDAVANGTLIAVTRALAQNPGSLSGGGSTAGFSDITLELPLLFEVFDFAVVDGDVITLRVTDQNGLQLGPVNITLSGPGAAGLFAPEVTPGPVEISVTAVNTGALFPNTGQVNILSNITVGNTTQQFSLVTGETGVLSITAVPPAD